MIIPIFIPHEGCPNDCAFCNQRTISGKTATPDVENVVKTIEEHLFTMDGKADQIAFFGGSFTGIDTERQDEYLSVAYKYIKSGNIKSIRLSTRPDYITNETVKRLKSYGVSNIELGAQSMDEDVLRLSNRGHSVKDVEIASEIINTQGITLGLQMMTGLPGDSEKKCLYTAKRFKELGAKETRIYPTVVLKGTLLAKMFENDEYVPHSVEDAVSISAKLYRFFNENGIEILRMGLPDSVELKENYVAGAYHPSLGEMIVSRDIRNRIEEVSLNGEKIEILANRRYLSKIIGNKKCNIEYFKNKGIDIVLTEDNSVNDFKIKVKS